MAIKETDKIKVFNRTQTRICFNVKDRAYDFPPARGESPVFNRMPYEDVDYVNNRTPLFKNGCLTFEDNLAGKIYKELGIDVKDGTIWTEADIRDAIVNPTPENQKKIIALKDELTVERLRAELVGLMNSGQYDVSNRVADLVNGRYQELRRGIVASRLSVDESALPDNKAVDELAKQNANLQKQIEELKAAIAGLTTGEAAKPAAARTTRRSAAKKAEE